jgi:CRP-like cAMP-binding protein
VGLPATLTKRNYSMTATVGQNAELGFWPSEALQLLLRQRPELCQQLLAVLGERMSENQQVAKALLREGIAAIVGPDQSDRAHNDHQNHGQNDRVFRTVFALVVRPCFSRKCVQLGKDNPTAVA